MYKKNLVITSLHTYFYMHDYFESDVEFLGIPLLLIGRHLKYINKQ